MITTEEGFGEVMVLHVSVQVTQKVKVLQMAENPSTKQNIDS